jgi:hypothetical protein
MGCLCSDCTGWNVPDLSRADCGRTSKQVTTDPSHKHDLPFIGSRGFAEGKTTTGIREHSQVNRPQQTYDFRTYEK